MKKVINRNIQIINGEKYQVFICPKCQNQLKYKMGKTQMRFHGACSKCGKVIEVLVDKA